MHAPMRKNTREWVKGKSKAFTVSLTGKELSFKDDMEQYLVTYKRIPWDLKFTFKLNQVSMNQSVPFKTVFEYMCSCDLRTQKMYKRHVLHIEETTVGDVGKANKKLMSYLSTIARKCLIEGFKPS